MEQAVESLSHLLVRQIFPALQGRFAQLDGFNQAVFFRETEADNLLRERISVTAALGGKFRKLMLLLGARCISICVSVGAQVAPVNEPQIQGNHIEVEFWRLFAPSRNIFKYSLETESRGL
jgi:hypothetical protein